MSRFTKLVFLCLASMSLNATSFEVHDRFCDECYQPGFLPAALPVEHQFCSIFAGADLLIWSANKTNLDYGVKQSSSDAITIGKGKRKYADIQFHPAVRGYVGFQWDCEGWDFRGIYTLLDVDDSSKVTGGVNDDIGAAMTPSTLLETVSHAKSSFGIKYKTIDFLFSRPFCISRTLVMRPFFGYRHLKLEQNLKINYEESSEEEFVEVNWDSDFKSNGIHIGTDWLVNMGSVYRGTLGLYATTAGSIVYGSVRDHNNHQNNDEGELTDIIDETACYDQGLPGLHLGFGVSYETCFFYRYFVLNLGYEFNQWFLVPEARRYTELNPQGRASSSSVGGLLVHGLKINAEIYF